MVAGYTNLVVESVAVKVPGRKELNPLALGLGPLVTVGQRLEQNKSTNGEGKERDCGDAVHDRALAEAEDRESGRQVVKHLAESNDSKVQGWEVVVKEELTLHQEEGEVVQGPAQNRRADFVVEALEAGRRVVIAASLPSQDGNTLEHNPQGDGDGGSVPDNGVTQEVDLGVVLAPEVDTTAHNGPRLGARVPCVRISETGVGLPHDLLELPELAKESRLAVVDLLGIVTKHGVLVVLNVPDTVGETATASASNLLLLRRPLRKLDLVREENAAGHDVHKSELGLNGADALLGNGVERLLLDNLDAEEVVGVTFEALVTVGGDLVLPVSLGDGRANVVGVEAAESRLVEQAKHGAVLDVLGLRQVVPSVGSVDGLAVNTEGLGLVLEKPDVVLVLVRVQSNLLLLATGRVHEGVRVQVSALGVDVTNGYTATHEDIGGHVFGGLVIERSLELGAHEAIAVARVGQAQKVDGKHGEVEGDGNDNEAEDSGHEVLGPETNRDVLVVAEQDPELDKGQGANPGNGEEANPLDAGSDAKTKTSHGEPEPPGNAKGLGGAELVLVREAVEGERGEGGSGDEGRVEEDQSCLGEKTVF